MGEIIYRTLDEKTYKAAVKKLLIKHESRIAYVYLDSVGVPTLGTGRALVVRIQVKINEKTVERYVFDPMVEIEYKKATGRNFPADIKVAAENAAEVLNKHRSNKSINKEVRDRLSLRENMKFFYKEGASSAWSERTNRPELSKFGIILDTKNNELVKFEDAVIETYEGLFKNRFEVKNLTVPPFSEERVRMMSIFYNWPKVFKNLGVVKAFATKDRDVIVDALFEAIKGAGLSEPRLREDVKNIGRSNDPNVMRNEQNPQRELEDLLFKGGTQGGGVSFTGMKGGIVQVAAHYREGKPVRAHERGAPDGDEGNNLGRSVLRDVFKG